MTAMRYIAPSGGTCRLNHSVASLVACSQHLARTSPRARGAPPQETSIAILTAYARPSRGLFHPDARARLAGVAANLVLAAKSRHTFRDLIRRLLLGVAFAIADDREVLHAEDLGRAAADARDLPVD